MILPTTVAGSYPRPLWFDRSLDGRLFKSALCDSLFREQYLDAVAAIIAAQEDRAKRLRSTHVIGGQVPLSFPRSGIAAALRCPKSSFCPPPPPSLSPSRPAALPLASLPPPA